MKKEFFLKLLGLFFLTTTSSSIAAPFLISDPYPLTEPQPLAFKVYIGGVLVQTVKASTNDRGEQYLKVDLSKYAIKNKDIAIQANNGWGISEPSSVYVYTHPSSPRLIGLSNILSCRFGAKPITCF